MEPPRIPLNAMKPTSTNFNSPVSSTKPVKPFFTSATDLLKSSPSALPPAPRGPGRPPNPNKEKDQKPKKLLSADDMPTFRAAIEGSDLSKLGLIEVLKKKFPGRPAATIKATLEATAKREGAKEAEKRWRVVG